MPANNSVIPLKAFRSGDQQNGDVNAIGELQTGDKIGIQHINTGTLATNAAFQSALANTNAYIASVAASGGEVANSYLTSTFTTNTAFQSALANTNAYIATKLDSSSYTTADVQSKAALANTNAYIATVSATERSALANTNAYIATKVDSSTLGSYWPSANVIAYVGTEVSALVDSAPATLDTLNELAAALGDDANFATTVSTNIGQKLGATATITLTGDITASATAFSANAVSIATTDTNLANTNAYIASVSATERSALANTNAYIATKVNSSNPTITGALSANGSVGTSGYVLKSAGAGNPAYWDASSGSSTTPFPFFVGGSQVNTINISDGQFPFYDNFGNADNIGAAPSGLATINNINDVTATNAVNGHVLRYNGTAWVGGFFDGVPDAIDVDASAPDDSLVINSAGNVGIGTSSPVTKLHVQGGQVTDGGLTYNQQLTSTAAYNASPAAGSLVSLQYNSGGAVAGMGGWSINKENSTDGNYAGYMAFFTRPNAGSTTERMRIDSSGDVLIGTTTSIGALTISADSSTTNNRALHLTITDDDPTATTYATYIDYNISGATATGGDTNHMALRVDTDSSATGGDTSDEHRIYSIYNTVDVSGDSNLVYGHYNDVRVSHSEGTISNLYGVYTLLESDNSGGTVSTAMANRNLMYVNGTGNTTNAYADFNLTLLQDPSTTTSAYGSFNEVQIETNATVTNVFGVRSLIDENGGSSTGEYLFHGQYDGTPSGSGYGLYILNETKNYISGKVGIGATSPTTSLEINAANTLGATFTGTTAGEGIEVSQTSYTADNYVSLIEGKYLASQSAPHVRIGAQYTGGGSKLVFGTTNNYGSGITNSALTIDPNGDVLPGANGTQDFGSTSLRWANIYTSDLHLNNGIGNYTIVEGEEDLFLYNNKNGKTYKFVLAEVDPSEAPKKMEK